MCCACRARSPCCRQHVCPLVDVRQVRPAAPLPRMLLQEEGVGVRYPCGIIPAWQVDLQQGVVALNPALPWVPARD